MDELKSGYPAKKWMLKFLLIAPWLFDGQYCRKTIAIPTKMRWRSSVPTGSWAMITQNSRFGVFSPGEHRSVHEYVPLQTGRYGLWIFNGPHGSSEVAWCQPICCGAISMFCKKWFCICDGIGFWAGCKIRFIRLLACAARSVKHFNVGMVISATSERVLPLRWINSNGIN